LRRIIKVNKAPTRILLIIIVLVLAAMACVSGGGGEGGQNGSAGNITSSQHGLNSADATAVYGAEQLHIQLTEIAKPGQ
jgi:hypothetical protein